MPTYSKSHERDEVRLMNKGFFRSLLALILCWLPVVGLLLAVSGFWRMAVRVTQAHRARRLVLTVFSVVVLTLCVGVLVYESYEYVHNPNVLNDITKLAWKTMTGEETPPWETQSYTGSDAYSNYGFDPYAGDPDDPAYDEDPGTDYDFDYDPDADFDADFDDSELREFEEDDSTDQEARDLLDQMIQERRSPPPVAPVVPVG